METDSINIVFLQATHELLLVDNWSKRLSKTTRQQLFNKFCFLMFLVTVLLPWHETLSQAQSATSRIAIWHYYNQPRSPNYKHIDNFDIRHKRTDVRYSLIISIPIFHQIHKLITRAVKYVFIFDKVISNSTVISVCLHTAVFRRWPHEDRYNKMKLPRGLSSLDKHYYNFPHSHYGSPCISHCIQIHLQVHQKN